jgi:hypothetical protein
MRSVIAGMLCAGVAYFLMANASRAQTLTPLLHQLPSGVTLSFVLTDGTVMSQDGVDPALWWRLTPDINGSYVKGTWTPRASPPAAYAPSDFASAVLADGRLLIMGGEYSTLQFTFSLTNQGAIYDPVADFWTPVPAPDGWETIGDSPSVVLPDGRFLLGQKLTTRISELDPKSLCWTEVSAKGKQYFNAEEGWTLLPDGTVLTADVKDAPHAEIYSPYRHAWEAAGSTIVDLHSPTGVVGCLSYGPAARDCYYPPGEIGPAILRPDGTVFATGSFANNDPNFGAGSAGHSAIYDTHTKRWTTGPDFPLEDNAGDSFAVLLPNGHVLVEGVEFGSGYEFDGSRLIATTSTSVYLGSLSVLPTGEVLAGGFPAVYAPGYPTLVYASTGTYSSAWAPSITEIDAQTLRPGTIHRVWGRQFNGLSQAQAFGDELQAAQNYPLVRIRNKASGHVFYARTHDHSTMAVATGDRIVWTKFDVPVSIESGESTLVVVANGIPSEPVTVWIGGT